jgi:hypothetical protein
VGIDINLAHREPVPPIEGVVLFFYQNNNLYPEPLISDYQADVIL